MTDTRGLAPEEATVSVEVDVAFEHDPDDQRHNLVDGVIGELSRFHQEFG